MRYTGIQPQYFPRLHYFARILAADIYMVRDDAQFVRKHKYPDGRVDKSYQAHTIIKQATGVQFLSLPTKHLGFMPIARTIIPYDGDWVDVHLKSIHVNYRKAKNFDRLYSEVENILNQKYETLADLDIAIIFWGILHLLGEEKVTPDMLFSESIEKKLERQKKFRLGKIRRASLSSAISDKMSANEKIVALIDEVGANEDYCGGTAAQAYMDEDLFAKNGINVVVQDWKCREYLQLFAKLGFIPNLSIIDLLMNVPWDEAVEIIQG